MDFGPDYRNDPGLADATEDRAMLKYSAHADTSKLPDAHWLRQWQRNPAIAP
jgi:hypothetical protein